MKCSNCGAEIPYAGKVCPMCHAEKSKDKRVHEQIVTGVVLASIGIVAGIMFEIGFFRTMALAFGLGVVGMIACDKIRS